MINDRKLTLFFKKDVICNKMNNIYNPNQMSKYAEIFREKNNGACLYTSYNGFINYFKTTNWNDGAVSAGGIIFS